jgi:UDP-3-O-[3-hydroxymyristoyl] glucosamine N-acyltransferase
MELALEELAEKTGGVVRGDSTVRISGIATPTDARPGDIVVIESEKHLPLLDETQASAAVVSRELPESPIALIVSPNPRLSFARILTLFADVPTPSQGVSPDAWISRSATLGENVTLGPLVYIGDDAQIGARAYLYPGVYVGAGARIGEDCILYPNVTVYGKCLVGNRVIVHAGAVIGSDGFGYVRDGDVHVKLAQIGIVEVEDDVEIGANSCIDRATLGKTVIKRGAKVDNLVQIAHNVSVGEHSIVVAQVGIAGSSTLGTHVTLAGQVGVADHVDVGDNVVVGAQSGIMRDVPPGQTIVGTPSLPYRQALRVAAVWERLPELKKEVERLEMRLEQMEKLLAGETDRRGGDDS